MLKALIKPNGLVAFYLDGVAIRETRSPLEDQDQWEYAIRWIRWNVNPNARAPWEW